MKCNGIEPEKNVSQFSHENSEQKVRERKRKQIMHV